MTTSKTIPFLFLLIVLLISNSANSQLTGTKTIDNTTPTGGNNYQTFTDAFNALNTSGVGAGGVIFNVIPGQTFNENPPELNATGTAGNPIVIQKGGPGTNPLVRPIIPGALSTTTLGNNADGIIILNGGDYITIDGISIDGNNSFFDAATEKYEYGYYFKKASGTDACQNVTVRNAIITLYHNTGAVVGVGSGIFISNISGMASVTVTANSGRSENIKIYNCNFEGCYNGIQARGFTTTAFYDQNIDIGVDGVNNIQNFAGGSVTGMGFGIWAGFQNNLEIANNNIVSAFTGATIQGISLRPSSNASADVYNNTITMTGTSTLYGIFTDFGAGTGVLRVFNNTITGFNTSGSSATIYAMSIGSSPRNALIYGNIITNNILSGDGGSFYGMDVDTDAGDTVRIYDNTITSNTKGGASGTMRCIANTAASTTKSIEIFNNTVSGNRVSGDGTLYCINHSTGANAYIFRNRIFDNAIMLGGSVFGIYISTGTIQTIYNNFISELYSPGGTDGAVVGMELNGTSTQRIYYNTIYLDAVSTAPVFESIGVDHVSGSGTLDLRNNLIVNLSSPGSDPNSYTTALRRSTTTLTNYANTSNNNNLFVGTPSAKKIIFTDGVNSDQTIGEFKLRMAPRDSASFTELSPFVNVATHPYDIHINPNIATATESGARIISSPLSITTDGEGTARFPNAGYPNNANPSYAATAPDVGADEFGGIPRDLILPSISYTALGNTTSLSDRTLTATITDASGIAASPNKPRLYYKKYAQGTYAFDDNPSIAGNNYTFTINYANIGGITTNERIQYYVAAQDLNNNMNTNPGGGSGINPPGTNAPATVNSYYVYDAAAMNGIYTIGSTLFNAITGLNLNFVKETITDKKSGEQREVAIPYSNGAKYTGSMYHEFTQAEKDQFGITEGLGVFATIGDAILNLSLRGVSGPVTFSLLDGSYSTNETFPLTINPVTGASASNTITFKPGAGVTTSISGASLTSIIKLTGADYIIFDGSNSAGGSSRDLTITNTGTNASTAAVWISSTGAGAGATNNRIANCNISCGFDQSTGTILTFGIVSSGTTISATGDGADNDFNTYENNYITKCRTAIHVRGVSSNTNNNTTINGNLIGPASFGSDQIGIGGIIIQHQDNATVTQNTVRYVGGTFATTTGGADRIGIGVGANNWTTTNTLITNSTIARNLIYEIREERVNTAAGIVIGTTSTNATNNKIVNNIIHSIYSNSASSDNTLGIGIGSGNTDIVAFNSIYLFGDLDPGSITDAVGSACGVRISSNTAVINLTLKNNIFAVDVFSSNVSVRHFSFVAPAVSFPWGTGGAGYNNYYINTGNAQLAIGGIGTSNPYTVIQLLEQWRTQFTPNQDFYSMTQLPGFISATDLQPNILNSSCWYVNGMGQIISSVNYDYNNNPRSTDVANGPVDIGAFEFTPDGSNVPPAVILDEIIAVGRIQQMFFADRKIGEISWTGGSNLPSDIDVRFRPGTTPPSPIGGGYGRAYWTVTPTGGTNYVYDMILTYEENQLGNVTPESDARMGKFDAGTWTIYNDAVVNTANNTITKTNLTSFSSFAVSDLNNPLPVELSSFTASINKRNVNLNWATAMEQNNSGFDIERSLINEHNQQWSKIGFVGGAGSSNEVKNYSFNDNNLQTGKYNYRLKQIDYNGNFEYFNLEGTIEVGVPNEFSLSQNYPNPFNPATKIDYDLPFESRVNLKIYDLLGREIHSAINNELMKAGYYTTQLNLSSMPSGTYFYRITAQGNGEEFVMTKKMVLIK